MASKPDPIHDEITAATSAEISRLIADFETKKRAVVTEQAALYKARVSGQSLDTVPPPALAEARKLAATMLNGHAPADFLQQFPTRSREAQLELEKEAIGIVIDTLQKDTLKARAAEAVAWRAAHIDQWRDLWRDALLTRATLKGYQAQIAAMAKEASFAEMPLAGWGPMLLEENRLIAFDRCLNEAIASGIIDARELREATDVED
jgi:hypothetical protein